ncbi:MAG: hypothetical protein F4Y61_07880 [Rhodothermaceae bacterium]|nr:hypothetical protein [Rhodothermaceae bacterium]
MKRVLISAAAVLAVLATTAVATGQVEVTIDKAKGPAAMEHIVVRGAGDGSVDLGRKMGPGVWRLSVGLGLDSRTAHVDVQDRSGQSCGATPPPVIVVLVSRGAGGVCDGGGHTLTVGGASSSRLVTLECYGGGRHDGHPDCGGKEGRLMVSQSTHTEWVIVLERLARAG